MSEPLDQAERVKALWDERHGSIDTVAEQTGWSRSEIMLLLMFNVLGHLYAQGLARDAASRELEPMLKMQRKVLEDMTKGEDWETRI